MIGGVKQVERQIAKAGRTLTLRRMVSGEPLDVPGGVKGVVRNDAPQNFVGDIKQGDRWVKISNKEIRETNWPGPPIRGDKFVIDGRLNNVESVDPQYLGEDIASFVIQVRG